MSALGKFAAFLPAGVSWVPLVHRTQRLGIL
jgi:hypothetical protein